jgi:hypothetical protein
MRHLGSLVLSLILAPAIWVLTGFGWVRYHLSLAGFDGDVTAPIVGLAALLAAGSLLAVLVMARLSPVGPGLAGLAFLAMTAWLAVDATSFHRIMPDLFLGTDSPTYLAEGLAVPLAVPLLATVLSPRRWRRYDHVPALYSPDPGYSAPLTRPGGILPGWEEPSQELDGDTRRLPGTPPPVDPHPTQRF